VEFSSTVGYGARACVVSALAVTLAGMLYLAALTLLLT
jgi:hypothetical protein